MKKLFIDTNIILDLLAQREPFYEASAILFSLADKKEVSLAVSSLTFANIHYVLSKLKSKREARTILSKFKVLVAILALDDKIIDLALADEGFTNFEDALQYYSALENQIDTIITRSQKNFKKSILPVMSAKEFLSGLR